MAMQARLRSRNPSPIQGNLGTIREEADLHGQIVEFCRGRGWLPLHSRMDKPTGRTLGEPDFIIFAEFPKLYLLECKKPGGKLSPVQQQTLAWLTKLGWSNHVVMSYEEFLAIVHPQVPPV
jgi:hypothetical protein